MRLRSGHIVSIAAVCVAMAAGVLAGCGGSHTSPSVPSSGDGVLRPQLNGGGGSLGALSTLYVSGQGAVYAYDLTSLTSPPPSPGAMVSPAPINKTTGYYYQAGGPGGVNASIAGIATNSSGDLIIVQNYTNPQGDGNSCALAYIEARTSTAAANAVYAPCNNGTVTGNTPGAALGVTFTGPSTGASPIPSPAPFNDDVDVLMHYVASGNATHKGCDFTNNEQYEVDRYQVGTATPGPIAPHASCIPLPSPSPTVSGSPYPRNYIAGSTNGAFFVDSTGGATLERFSGTATTNTGTIPAPGPLAVSANTTTSIGYRVVASNSGGVTTIYSFKNSGGGFSFTHALGTFTNTVGALAVDNNGTIYVGVDQAAGVTKIKVYGPTKTQATDPDYVLLNPVRRPNPSASPAAIITGIAIAQ
jgi:hypothetical protein